MAFRRPRHYIWDSHRRIASPPTTFSLESRRWSLLAQLSPPSTCVLDAMPGLFDQTPRTRWRTAQPKNSGAAHAPLVLVAPYSPTSLTTRPEEVPTSIGVAACNDAGLLRHWLGHDHDSKSGNHESPTLLHCLHAQTRSSGCLPLTPHADRVRPDTKRMNAFPKDYQETRFSGPCR